jgi:hypothetical protein
MLGYHISFDIFFLIVASTITIYLLTAKNPFEKGTHENKSLRICRIGLAFLIWSLGILKYGLIIAVVSLISGLIGIIKVRIQY